MGKAKRQPLSRLMGKQVPTVDVFITYCGEELDVLMDTLRAATVLDYPQDRYRVIVLDDSVSDRVKAEVQGIGQRIGNVYYSSRGSRPKTHTKAGNINHGLKYVQSLAGGASEMVAVLDVDMIPSPHWLRSCIPHILTDPKVAMANPPQRHYNVPNGDPLGQTMHILFDVMEPLKNATNAAWCCGSGFVVRRKALDEIDGVPEESINEDILTSFYLTAAGWKIVYVPEDVQWGLVPTKIMSHLKLQKRMCAGIISTAAGAWNPRSRTMTTEEKYNALFPAVAFATAVVTNMAIFVILPWLLWTGAPLIAYSTEAQFGRLVVLFLVQYLSLFLYNLVASQATNYQLSLAGVSNSWPIPFQFLTIIRFALSILTGGGVPLFTPTGLTDFASERSLAHRVKVAFWDNGFVVHVAIIASLLLGVAASAKAALDLNSTQGVVRELVVRAFWPPVFMIWSGYILECSTPISWAIDPPKALPRSQLVDRDAQTQVAYPNQLGKDPVRIRRPQAFPIARISYCFVASIVLLYWR
ncbi:MAG: hypothetical protein Q9183_005815 [Haloplaca sp. 2 TL-2023]